MTRVKTKTNSRLKLVHHQHTGRRIAHTHTSYHGLVLILGLAGLVIALIIGLSGSVRADSDFGVTASVFASPPGQAAQISQPHEGDSFTSNPITVAGTCEVANPAHVVKIFSNNQLIGSTTCSGAGTFGLNVDLFSGSNTLVPHIYTFQNIEGPVGDPVHVTLNLPTPPPSSGGNGSQSPTGSGSSSTPSQAPAEATDFRLSPSDANLFFVPGKPLEVVFTISGGTPPYTVKIDWGDGELTELSFDSSQEVKLTHTFHGVGPYTIQIDGTDSADNTAHLELVAVSGSPTPSNSTGSSSTSNDRGPLGFLRKLRRELFSGSNGVVMISYLAVSMLTISFWLGGRWFLLLAARRRRHKSNA